MDLRKEKWVLRLFVAGRSWLATSAHASMCEEHLPDRYRIDVIDVEEDPALARQHAVVALSWEIFPIRSARCSPSR